MTTASNDIILVLGSAPDAVVTRDWPRAPFTKIVAINNAHGVRDDWDIWAPSTDFPTDRAPRLKPAQQVMLQPLYVDALSRFGGQSLVGNTQQFTASYATLFALRPKAMVFCGCDFDYSTPETHFYGTGTPDPLRDDPTLRNLTAKSARFMAIALSEGCVVLNASEKPQSRLCYPRVVPQSLATQDWARMLKTARQNLNKTAMREAMQAEQRSGYGDQRFWLSAEPKWLNPKLIAQIDGLWLTTVSAVATPTQPRSAPL